MIWLYWLIHETSLILYVYVSSISVLILILVRVREKAQRFNVTFCTLTSLVTTGHGSSIGSVSAWHASGH